MIKKDEIILLWDSLTPPRTWSGLIDVINDYLNRPEWEDNENFAFIRDFAELRLAEPFPRNADELYRMLNDQINKE